MCTFQWVWLLFRPECIVYTWEDDMLTTRPLESQERKGLFDKGQAHEPTTQQELEFCEYKHRSEAVVMLTFHLEFDCDLPRIFSSSPSSWSYSRARNRLLLCPHPQQRSGKMLRLHKENGTMDEDLDADDSGPAQHHPEDMRHDSHDPSDGDFVSDVQETNLAIKAHRTRAEKCPEWPHALYM